MGQWVYGMWNECEMGCVIKAMTTFFLCPCYNNIMCVDLHNLGECCNKTRLYSVWGQKRTLSMAPFTRQMRLVGSHSLPDDISVWIVVKQNRLTKNWFRDSKAQAMHHLYVTNIFMVSGFSIWGKYTHETVLHFIMRIPPHLYVEMAISILYGALQWRHNGQDGVSNHQPHDCLLNR